MTYRGSKNPILTSQISLDDLLRADIDSDSHFEPVSDLPTVREGVHDESDEDNIAEKDLVGTHDNCMYKYESYLAVCIYVV